VPRQAVVIGAGLGGLGTAIRLQLAGWQVTVLEKNETVGGRCNVIREGGFTFDTGPTLLLMRDVLDDLFAYAGRRLSDYLDLTRVSPNYRVHFADGSGITLSADLDRLESDLEAFESGAGLAFRRYLADAGYKYQVSRDRFVERNFTSWRQFATAKNLYYLLATNTLRKLDRHAERYFRDPRLVAAFTFQTMYLGLAPADAPAIYSLLPYTEMEEGIWFPRGGMYSIAESLSRLAAELGVRILTGQTVTGLALQGKRVVGVHVANGDDLPASVVISNADLPYSYAGLVPEGHRGRFTARTLRRLNYGSSAFLLYLGFNREYPELNHHDVYLSGDTAGNFEAIFRDGVLPSDPSYYVCAASRTDRSLAPPRNEAIYVLVPVPRLSDRVDWDLEGAAFKETIFRKLESGALPDLRSHLVFERTYTPREFASDYNLMNGSAFGLSHGFRQVGYLRPSNKARDIDNLYFVGASTVPGGGVPMVLIGSRLTAERVTGDWARG
jgi:phytoene desaturase